MILALAHTGNASSVHADGRQARARVEEARRQVAVLVGCAPRAVVFTAGGTEANNLALSGLPDRRRLVSAGEHESVLQVDPAAQHLPLTADGRLDLVGLEAALAEGPPALVSLMLANNETGVLQPIAEAADLVHAAGGLLHVDAVQGAGRLPLDREAPGADLLTLSAHKIGGPQGVGALIVRDGLDLRPLLRGGGQELRRRAGTENVAGIVGFGAAAAAAAEDWQAMAAVAALRDEMETRLRALSAEVVIFGASAPRLPNTCCFALPGVTAEVALAALDLAGIALSSGSACSSGKVQPSHVLMAMGVAEGLARRALRASLGLGSTVAEVDRFVAAVRQLLDRRRTLAA
mgnify:CR=1 FL=1